MKKKEPKEHRVRAKGLEGCKMKILDRFCYVKVKTDEFEEEKAQLQKKILSWKDRPDKTGIEVPPYGTLRLSTRANWTVLKLPVLFKKIGKDIFLEICSVTTGKLKKAIGTVGFGKLEKLGIIEQGEDSEFYTLKKSPAINGAIKGK